VDARQCDLGIFRARSFGTAWQVLRGMSGQNGAAKPILDTVFLVVVHWSSPASLSVTG